MNTQIVRVPVRVHDSALLVSLSPKGVHETMSEGDSRTNGVRALGGVLLGWSSLVLAALEALCAAAVALSGVRVLFGLSSLIAASAAGPAEGFHRNALRLPILWASGVLAVITLVLWWNEERIRRNPSAQWRLQPLTRRQRAFRWMQVGSSVAALLLILAEVLTHPLFHREL